MSDPQYPRGKIRSDDEGELGIRIGVHRTTQTVIVDFGKPIKWIGFSVENARELAAKIVECADSLKEAEAQQETEA